METNSKKIAIVICYFGKFPWYFLYFIHSCKYNSTIDFLIFSDSDFLYPAENIKFYNISIDYFKAVATKKFGFKVNLDSPYKLCDYKPAYGLIFSEFLSTYDFWGQSDIDNIFGNIRGFITDQILAEYDFVSSRHDYTTGCFTLYKNNKLINNIFKRSADFKKIFSSEKYFGFDEFNFFHHLLADAKSIYDIETEIETYTHIIKSAVIKGEIKAYFDFMLIEGLPGRIKFEEGKIIYKNTYEAILYHLYWLKRVYNPVYVSDVIPNIYYISKTQIYY